VELVAPEIPAQFAPVLSHRSHWYLNDVGVFDHCPALAVRVRPERAEPEIVGRLVLTGSGGGDGGGGGGEDDAVYVAYRDIRSPSIVGAPNGFVGPDA
jgi:hypothetical protein